MSNEIKRTHNTDSLAVDRDRNKFKYTIVENVVTFTSKHKGQGRSKFRELGQNNTTGSHVTQGLKTKGVLHQV